MNTKPFDNFEIIDCGSIFLSGISENLDLESVGLFLSRSNSQARRFLERCPVNIEEANDEIFKMIASFSLKSRLTYTIKLKKNGTTLGFIHIYTPDNYTEIKDWLIEYYLMEQYWGKGITTVCLGNVLTFLKKNDVKTIKAVVDYENFASKRVLQKLGFEYFAENQSIAKEVYGLVLSHEF